MATGHEARRAALRARYGVDNSDTEARAGSVERTGGIDHLALVSSDIERTLAFYTEVLGMRVTRIVANRDEPSSTHVFLDIGGGNLLAFFDFPESGVHPALPGSGGMHHMAMRATPEQYAAVVQGLKTRRIPHSIHGDEAAGSCYFRDPDGILLEVRTAYRRQEQSPA
ncbi:MAG: VOC family protein [Alphaproteobacteria bacterium]